MPKNIHITPEEGSCEAWLNFSIIIFSLESKQINKKDHISFPDL